MFRGLNKRHCRSKWVVFGGTKWCYCFCNAKCFSYILTEQEKLQKCYQSIAVRIFTQYYGLSNNEALLKYNKHKEFLQQEYQFVYGNTIYCKENNCGIAPDLYSEYATSQGLYTYIKKTMSYIENQ